MKSLYSKPTLICLTCFALATACSQESTHDYRAKPTKVSKPKTPSLPTKESPAPTADDPQSTVIPAGNLPVRNSDGDKINLPGGEFIAVTMVAGKPYIQVEAAIGDIGFRRLMTSATAFSTSESERLAYLSLPLNETVTSLQKHAAISQIKRYPEYGYFSALMALESYESLQGSALKLPNTLMINPVITSPLDERSIRKLDAESINALDKAADFSGLKRMGVTSFLEQIQDELGITPDGSRVAVGVTDTGVTFNHPSFYDADKKNRITYMRDFTGEGRAYFNPAAKFVVKESEGKLTLTAEYIQSLVGPSSQPVADELALLEDKELLVPEALRPILLAKGSGAKLGIISESSFGNRRDKVDINYNGKSDDTFYAILIPHEESYKIYLSGTGNLDFRKANAVGDFSINKETISWGSEKFGLDIRPMKLKNGAGEDIDMVTASIVGFDPGNHGSHVSGIIGGSKTISNDRNDTLARGVAPNTNLMVNRVCSNNGGCRSTEAFIDLVDAGAEIINMSLGGLSAYNDGYSVSEAIINRLTEQKNVLFVISAGNSGPGLNTTGSPSNARYAISVGATATNKMINAQYQWPGKGTIGGSDTAERDFVMDFSSRGPNAAGGFKPNITAPGTQLSAIQLNNANGSRAGLDVFWGTSMAAPAAAGAIALLLDAAKAYNAQHPKSPLLFDSLSLRQAIIDSAKPFDVNRFDPKTGKYTKGQYTWIDQGTGMINLPSAWEALKIASSSKLVPAPVVAAENGKQVPIKLDYTARVLRKNPNGLKYDGSRVLAPDAFALTGSAYGQGIWLDSKGLDSMVRVQIARRLPFSATLRADAGELRRQLVTSQDTFKFEVIYYGSKKKWLKVGVIDQLNCNNDRKKGGNVTVIGEGAVDNLAATSGTSSGLSASNLNVCINRKMLANLPAGDHGAMIRAFRTDGTNTEVQPSFMVPVYMTQPHQTMAGEAKFEANESVRSMATKRHYIDIPEGTSLVTVKLELPEASVENNEVKGCMGVNLYIAEGGNTASPPELAKGGSIAVNCYTNGTPFPRRRFIEYSRSNPKAGIWDMHVFGRYRNALSSYKLTVEFAKVALSSQEIVGGIEALTGSLGFEILENSLDAAPSGEKSPFTLQGFGFESQGNAKTGDMVPMPNADEEIFRKYDAGINAVTISTSDSPGNDIDLMVLECTEASQSSCSLAGSSGAQGAEESVTIYPSKDKFYLVMVEGYKSELDEGAFKMLEVQAVQNIETTEINVVKTGESQYLLNFDFDTERSHILQSEAFKSGKFSALGSVIIRNQAGVQITSVPVRIK